MTTFVLAFDDFRRHVHWGTGHGLLFGDGDARRTGGSKVVVLIGRGGRGGGCWVCLKGFALASDDFGGAEVDVLDHTVVIEENVWMGERG